MIKVIIFDLGNVLLDFSHEKMIVQIAEVLNVPAATVRNKLMNEQLHSQYEQGEVTTDQFLEALNTLSATKSERHMLLNAMSDIFAENKEIVPIIKALQRQGKKLLLLSNTSEAHYHFIERKFPITKLFDHIVLSYEVKSAKPKPEIFRHALERAGYLPREVFYVDDVLEHVEAARLLGIDAELYQSVDDLRRKLALRMIFT